jgi:hypothetical protein
VVHVIVTCTHRKTAPVPARLRLSDIHRRTTAGIASAWIARLNGPSGPQSLAAEDLYAGEHWMIARRLPELSVTCAIRLWVCSAGYGLIPVAAKVRPYSASFSGQQDCVPGGVSGARWWWQALSGWEGPVPGQPRSIRDLAAANSSASFLLALSAAYLDACRDDITTAVRELPDPDRLMVVSAGARNAGPLADLMVPADARLQAATGGTRQALNSRIAALLLAAGITSRAEATCHLAELLAAQPPVPRYGRKQLSDNEVTAMIACCLAQVPGMSASRMLREFRDAGYACEQHRFAELHRQVAGATR